MARRYKRRRYKRRRRFRRFARVYKRYRRSRGIARKGTRLKIRRPIISDRVFVKLVYTDFVPFADATTAFAWYTFRGNSIYDPNYTGTGHYPSGYLNWATFFNRYKVHASKISVSFSWQSAAPGKLLIIPTTDETLSTDEQVWHYDDNPQCKWRYLPTSYFVSGDAVPTTTTALGKANQFSLKHFAFTQRITGVPMADVTQQSLFGTNPTKVWYWHVGTMNLGAGTSSNFKFVRIKYYVELCDRKELAVTSVDP